MFVSLPWRQSRAAEHGLGKNKTGAGRRDEEPQVATVALQECEYITNTLPSPHPTMAQVQGRRGPNIFCKYCYQISTKIMHITLDTFLHIKLKIAGDNIRQKLEFHHVHLELGALGYI